ncbi:sll0787 family AIR synthase-like protein [Lichenibacterium dinghuense]|uniref:sll0787 family AIR synthase-like protein n=1 Tax=Lichenibacterium dinghuense TaxID=2895977 RepID=UPI001F0194E7|nr:sll0787 family AIR synthase-like protein [Lichenibacterium sp. 6Y81]
MDRFVDDLAGRIRASRGMDGKRDIAGAVAALGLDAASAVPVGDDCAAIPDRDGWLLLAIEGFIDGFVAAEPWFAGYCGVMVNLSDVAAMGGRPVAVVDALWAADGAAAAPVLRGLRDGAARYRVPVVGGHTNARSERGGLAVAVLGRAARLMTSFDAEPGHDLVMAVDLRGAYRSDTSTNWDASTTAPAELLRGDLDLLAEISEAGLCAAAKDISMAGTVGTAGMLFECSGVGGTIDLLAVPRPEGADFHRWLASFPSFGFLLSVAPRDTAAVLARFAARGIAAARIGGVEAGHRLRITDGRHAATVWDFAEEPLIGCGGARA